jgi:hypothetical protein
VNDQDEEKKPPLTRWAGIVQPLSLATKTGKDRFLLTVKLPEKSLKTATKFVTELNDALQTKIAKTPGCELKTEFVLLDSERTRLQRAATSFCTFKEAQTCFLFLQELGLPVNEISAELEDFGTKKYDPWYESVSKSWWPWLAAWRNPAPEMPMMKVKNRLDLAEGGKYKEGAKGKLGKSDEVDRDDTYSDEPESEDKSRGKDKPRKDEGKKRRKKE